MFEIKDRDFVDLGDYRRAALKIRIILRRFIRAIELYKIGKFYKKEINSGNISEEKLIEEIILIIQDKTGGLKKISIVYVLATIINIIMKKQDSIDPIEHQDVAESLISLLFIINNKEFNEREVEVLKAAALLHDIGKTEVDKKILKKPKSKGTLTKREYESVKKHSIYGSNMIISISKEFPKQKEILIAIAKIVKHHHENEDGTGYPDGLTRDEIPEASLMLRVADVCAALAARRCYKESFPGKKIKRIIEQGIGTLFSAEIVANFMTFL